MHGATISAQKQDAWRETALHYAAAKGHSDMANLLLAFEADPTATNFAGRWCMQPDLLLLSLLQLQSAVLAAVKLLPVVRLVATNMPQHSLDATCAKPRQVNGLRCAGSTVALRTRWLSIPPAVPDTFGATVHDQTTLASVSFSPCMQQRQKMVATAS